MATKTLILVSSSDLIRSNNNDGPKVLATVVQTLYHFTDSYPDAIIVATGSAEARTRLYRMGITANLHAVEQDFYIRGLSEEIAWEDFRKAVTYLACSV